MSKQATQFVLDYYNKPGVNPTNRADALAIAEAMDSKPASLTELAVRAGVSLRNLPYQWRSVTYRNKSVSKCIHAMGKAGIVGMVEIQSHRKCVLRLYNAL